MSAGTYRETLKRQGLQPFLWTQFLGAFNDNLFKMVVSLVAARMATGDPGRDLSIVSAVFILPFILFSGYAGQLADVYSKRTALVVTKSLEIVATALGLIAFLIGHLHLTYAVLFLFALQATFFSPAKYGILPEMLPDRDLSRANGILEMSTFVAIVVGVAAGGAMFDLWQDRLWLIGIIVMAIALIGTAVSFRIPRVRASAPGARIDFNPWRQIGLGLKRLRRDRVLSLTVAGISYFWFLGALLQLVIILFGTQVMHLNDRWVGVLTAFAAIGIGAGSMAAGRLSGDKVELGLAPIGSIGMGLFAIALAHSGGSFALAALNLTLVGFFGGLFAVPLNALLQQRSGDREKGRLMATNNFLNMIGILVASGALSLCTNVFGLPADRIIFIFGVLTLELLEGYGCTEMAPIVAVNVPDVNDRGEHQRGARRGTVGHPLPGVVAKIVDPATGEGPLFNIEGLLLVRGPNRMKGYLGDPESTSDVFRDGWYVTGDIATIDESGFITITDRLSRFSKIAGEMVPHMKIEQQIHSLLDEHYACVVTAVPDPAKGERLIAFYTDPSLAPHELWERLCLTELPRLWLPKREDLRIIDAIPTLGTGKVDLRAIRRLAMGQV